MSNCRHGIEAHACDPRPNALHGKDDPAARATAVPFGVAPADETERRERVERLKGLLDERIVFLDGAMGTMIQPHKLDEHAFRGERFR